MTGIEEQVTNQHGWIRFAGHKRTMRARHVGKGRVSLPPRDFHLHHHDLTGAGCMAFPNTGLRLCETVPCPCYRYDDIFVVSGIAIKMESNGEHLGLYSCVILCF